MTCGFAKFLAAAGIVLMPGVLAHGARLGTPGVSTKGATSAQNQWNITCDPAYVDSGSITTVYSTNATIAEVLSIAPYQVTSVTVELQTNLGLAYNTYTANNGTVQIPFASFNNLAETGHVQVNFFDAAIQQAPSITGLQPADDPPADADTYELIFGQNPNSSNTMGSFTDTLYNYGSTPHAPPADFYMAVDPVAGSVTYSADPKSPDYVPPDMVDTETVQEVVGTPEPSCIALAGTLFTLALLRRTRSSAMLR